MRDENEKGAPHESVDGIPPLWERFPPNALFCDRCFLVKIAHVITAWYDVLALTEKEEYAEVVEAAERQSEVVEVPPPAKQPVQQPVERQPVRLAPASSPSSSRAAESRFGREITRTFMQSTAGIFG